MLLWLLLRWLWFWRALPDAISYKLYTYNWSRRWEWASGDCLAIASVADAMIISLTTYTWEDVQKMNLSIFSTPLFHLTRWKLLYLGKMQLDKKSPYILDEEHWNTLSPIKPSHWSSSLEAPKVILIIISNVSEHYEAHLQRGNGEAASASGRGNSRAVCSERSSVWCYGVMLWSGAVHLPACGLHDECNQCL